MRRDELTTVAREYETAVEAQAAIAKIMSGARGDFAFANISRDPACYMTHLAVSLRMSAAEISELLTRAGLEWSRWIVVEEAAE